MKSRYALAYICAFLTTYILGSLMQSFFTLRALQSAGARLRPMDWLRTAVHDLWGLAFQAHLVSYALLVMLGLAIAFAVAASVRRFAGCSPWLVYPLAGAVAIALILALAHGFFFGAHFFSATRSLGGRLSQVLAGAIGGSVFACMINRGKGG